MKILSIDIGIKNLALCLFEKDAQFSVRIWDVINISEEEDAFKCVVCNKTAAFQKGDACYCSKHAKKQTFKIPTANQTPAFIRKQKMSVLYEMAKDYGIQHDPKIKKQDLIHIIHSHLQQTYFDRIESKKAADVSLFHIGLNIKHKLNHLFKEETKIDYVIIENQIGPLAIRMKTIQGMIVQYFVMSTMQVDQIEFISASNKLKDCDAKDKEKYSDRKKLGIAKCVGIVTTDARFSEHLTYFNSHKKKDDLSDAFLQGMWFIDNKQL